LRLGLITRDFAFAFQSVQMFEGAVTAFNHETHRAGVICVHGGAQFQQRSPGQDQDPDDSHQDQKIQACLKLEFAKH